MAEKVTIGSATLWHGDAIELIAGWRDERRAPCLPNEPLGRETLLCDALVTDPPYGMDYKSGWATEALWTAGTSILGDKTTWARDQRIRVQPGLSLWRGKRCGCNALDAPAGPASKRLTSDISGLPKAGPLDGMVIRL
jgi:hypothetical protein